jgi:hypothetical protein
MEVPAENPIDFVSVDVHKLGKFIGGGLLPLRLAEFVGVESWRYVHADAYCGASLDAFQLGFEPGELSISVDGCARTRGNEASIKNDISVSSSLGGIVPALVEALWDVSYEILPAGL